MITDLTMAISLKQEDVTGKTTVVTISKYKLSTRQPALRAMIETTFYQRFL